MALRPPDEKYMSPTRGYFNAPPYLPPSASSSTHPPPPHTHASARTSASPDPHVMFRPPPPSHYPAPSPTTRAGSWGADPGSPPPRRSPMPAATPSPGGRPARHASIGSTPNAPVSRPGSLSLTAHDEPPYESLQLVARLARVTEPLGVHCHGAEGRVVVKGVAADGPAKRCGLKAGDVVVRVEEFEIRDQADMRRGRLVALDKGKTEIAIEVLRPRGGVATFPTFPRSTTGEARVAQQLGFLQAAYDSGALTRDNFRAEVVRVKGYIPEPWRRELEDEDDGMDSGSLPGIRPPHEGLLDAYPDAYDYHDTHSATPTEEAASPGRRSDGLDRFRRGRSAPYEFSVVPEDSMPPASEGADIEDTGPGDVPEPEPEPELEVTPAADPVTEPVPEAAPVTPPAADEPPAEPVPTAPDEGTADSGADVDAVGEPTPETEAGAGGAGDGDAGEGEAPAEGGEDVPDGPEEDL